MGSQEGTIRGVYLPARKDDAGPVSKAKGRGGVGAFPARAVDWIDRLRDDRDSRSPSMKSLKIYREFKITSAGKAWREHNYHAAVLAFKQAAQAFADFGDTDRALGLLKKGELARNHRDVQTEQKGNYEHYIFLLQVKLAKAFEKRDITTARDLLKQMVVISKSVKDVDLTRAYKGQLRAVEAVYKGKGTKNVGIQKIMRARLIDNLGQATIRAGLSFKQPYEAQVRVLAPILTA